MRSVVVCYAPPDAQFASELGVFLEVNCPVMVSYQESGDVLDAVERGLSDVTLVLLSPESVPKQWKRERWEPVLLQQPSAFGTQIGFVLIRDCKFPELLRRGDFFDLTNDRLAGQRQVKRWLLHQHTLDLPVSAPEGALSPDGFEHLRLALADQPGTVDDVSHQDALAFADAAAGDFEGVFRIDCTHRSRAGILGDVAQSLGLRLTGTVEQNRAALGVFCAERRCLFIFENIAPEHRDLVAFGGKTSAIMTVYPEQELNQNALELFSSWTRRSEECLRALGAASRALQQGPWPRKLQLGLSIVAFLKHWDRLAEAHEVLELLIHSAEACADFQSVNRLRWEQSWILEHWNQPVIIAGPNPFQPTQLTMWEMLFASAH